MRLWRRRLYAARSRIYAYIRMNSQRYKYFMPANGKCKQTSARSKIAYLNTIFSCKYACLCVCVFVSFTALIICLITTGDYKVKFTCKIYELRGSVVITTAQSCSATLQLCCFYSTVSDTCTHILLHIYY